MEDKYDIELKNKFGNLFYYKRFFIPTSIMMPFLIFFHIFRNNFYIFLSSFMSLLILTWNFPMISRILYSKPIYIEDLENDDIDEKKEKNKIMYNLELSNKFKTKFIIFQQFISSLAIAIFADYINEKYSNSDYTPMELFGLIGGILSLLLKIVRMCGKVILTILYKLKKREREKLLEQING